MIWFWRGVEQRRRSSGWILEHARSLAEARPLLGARDLDAVVVELDSDDRCDGQAVLELLASRPTPVATLGLSGAGGPAGGPTGANALGLDRTRFVELETFFEVVGDEVELNRMVTTRGVPGALATAEKRVLRKLLAALRATRGNQSAAARRLGIPRTTLRDRLGSMGFIARASRDGGLEPAQSAPQLTEPRQVARPRQGRICGADATSRWRRRPRRGCGTTRCSGTRCKTLGSWGVGDDCGEVPVAVTARVARRDWADLSAAVAHLRRAAPANPVHTRRVPRPPRAILFDLDGVLVASLDGPPYGVAAARIDTSPARSARRYTRRSSNMP